MTACQDTVIAGMSACNMQDKVSRVTPKYLQALEFG